MKIRIEHPLLQGAVGVLGATLVRGLLGTIRFHFHFKDPTIDPAVSLRTGRRFIYAFYHETLLIPAYLWSAPEMNTLISEHRDGELITQVASRLGASVVRGSTTRGGTRALSEMIHRIDQGHICITPDGPRGPRRKVQAGLAYLASRTGLPIAAGGLAFKNPWRARSWDRFAIPRPFSAAVVVGCVPLSVPPDADRATLEDHRCEIERRMIEATGEAEAWAEQL